MSWPPIAEDLVPKATLPVFEVGACALVVVLGVGAYVAYQHRQIIAERAAAKILKEVARDAEQREAKATAREKASGELAAQWKRERDEAQRKLSSLPPDPGLHPVPPDASLQLVAAGLHGLGIAPLLLGDNLGLNLPDSRKTLEWGYQAQRVGPLVARLETTTALVHAQEGEVGALHSQVDALQEAQSACDDRAAAEQRRADLLDSALRRMGRPRNWTVGGLVGLDFDGKKHLGAYATWSYKAVDVHAVYLNRTAAVGAGFRF